MKSAHGWKPVYVTAAGCDQAATMGGQILFRKLALGLSVGYLAKGPLVDPSRSSWSEISASFWADVDWVCKKEHAVFLKVEPDAWETSPADSDRPLAPGFIPNQKSIQPRRTLLVDLRGSEETLLARMKQKTRYNIHLAEKKGVVVCSEGDLESFYSLMSLTGERDLFGVHTREYYQRAYDLFSPSGECVLLIARVDKQPVAALMAFCRASRAWYFYGASSNEHRERMPAYLLQWEAIRWARSNSCLTYDLWGVPDYDEETLEAGFMEQAGGLWGVYRFKRGFGGKLMRSSAPQDKVYRPLLYRLYLLWSRHRSQD